MVHVIESLAIKPSNDVHNIAENNRTMKSSWLRLLLARGLNFCPFSLINIELVNVIESLLVGIYTTKDVDLVAANHSGVTIPGLWWRPICSMYLIPII
jgi:hypothetical protein